MKVDKGMSHKNNQESNEEIRTDINSETDGKIKNKSKVDKVDYIESPRKIPSEADYYIVHSTFPGIERRPINSISYFYKKNCRYFCTNYEFIIMLQDINLSEVGFLINFVMY